MQSQNLPIVLRMEILSEINKNDLGFDELASVRPITFEGTSDKILREYAQNLALILAVAESVSRNGGIENLSSAEIANRSIELKKILKETL